MQWLKIMVSSLLAGAVIGCSPKFYTAKPNAQFYAIKGADVKDSATALHHFLQPYQQGVDTMMNLIIGTTDVPLTKAAPECLLGNIIADATLQKALTYNNKVVGAVSNYGGIRKDYVAPGAITLGTVYEIMPFDNTLMILEVPGNILQQWCNHMANRKGWPIAGITYIIKDKKAIDIKINGKPINDNIVYTIATSDYIANGGDHCDMLQDLKRKNTGVFIREAIIDYIKGINAQGKILHPTIENRVTYAE